MPNPLQSPGKLRQAFFEQLGDEQAFVELYDHLPAVYFFVKDAEGRFIYVNQALKKVLGKQEQFTAAMAKTLIDKMRACVIELTGEAKTVRAHTPKADKNE